MTDGITQNDAKHGMRPRLLLFPALRIELREGYESRPLSEYHEKHMNNKHIATKRLLLRKLKETDAEPIFRNWANDPEVTKYLTWNPHENVEVTKQLVRVWLEEEKKPETIRFLITLKDKDEPIGAIDVVAYIDGNPEIGYCLSRKWWNQGLMTEACKAFTQYLFDAGFKKILIKAMEENLGSNRVIEKCGFQLTGKERVEHQSQFKPAPATLNYYELAK